MKAEIDSRIIACDHVASGTKPEVLLCDDRGLLDGALCKTCADNCLLEREPTDEDQKALSPYCVDHFFELPGIIAAGVRTSQFEVGGIWRLDSRGQYVPQTVN